MYLGSITVISFLFCLVGNASAPAILPGFYAFFLYAYLLQQFLFVSTTFGPKFVPLLMSKREHILLFWVCFFSLWGACVWPFSRYCLHGGGENFLELSQSNALSKIILFFSTTLFNTGIG